MVQLTKVEAAVVLEALGAPPLAEQFLDRPDRPAMTRRASSKIAAALRYAVEADRRARGARPAAVTPGDPAAT